MLSRELRDGPAESGVSVLPGRAEADSFAGRGRAAGIFGEDVRGGGDVARADDDDPRTAVGDSLRIDDPFWPTPLLV